MFIISIFLESIGTSLLHPSHRLQVRERVCARPPRAGPVTRHFGELRLDGEITTRRVGIDETHEPRGERIFGYLPRKSNWAKCLPLKIAGTLPRGTRRISRPLTEEPANTCQWDVREERERRKDGMFPMGWRSVVAIHVGQAQNRNSQQTGFVRDITRRKRLESEILEISDHRKHAASGTISKR
jgi:hypothetical protein